MTEDRKKSPASRAFSLDDDESPRQSFFFIMNSTATTAMTMPSSHSQYFSRKPFGAVFGAGVATTAGGMGSGWAATGAGAACCTTGAGAVSTGATGAGATFAFAFAFFLAFLTTGFGATSAVLATGAGAGCSATVGAGSAAVVCSTGAATGAGAATSSFLVAQAERARAETSRTKGKTALDVFDMLFSKVTVDDRRFSRNPPIVIRVRQTFDAAFIPENEGLNQKNRGAAGRFVSSRHAVFLPHIDPDAQSNQRTRPDAS